MVSINGQRNKINNMIIFKNFVSLIGISYISGPLSLLLVEFRIELLEEDIYLHQSDGIGEGGEWKGSDHCWEGIPGPKKEKSL